MKRFACLLAFAAASTLFAQRAPAATLKVPKGYPTIQAAVNAAHAGDRIEIAAGSYPESVAVPVGLQGLVLRGKGRVFLDLYGSPVAEPVGLHVDADDVRVEHIGVRHVQGTSGNGVGVEMKGKNARLLRVEVFGCGTGIRLEGEGARARWCKTAGNRRGIELSGSTGELRSCSSQLDDYGISVSGTAAGSRVVKCRASANDKLGIQVYADGARIEGCVSEGSGGNGMHLAGDHLTIRGNRVSSAASVGTWFIGSGAFEHNRIEDCRDAGLWTVSLAAADQKEICDNEFVRCGSKVTPQVYVASHSLFARNRVQHGRSRGIEITGSYVQVAQNEVTDHLSDGIYVAWGYAELTKNRVLRNHGEGVENTQPSTVLMDNTILGNRLDLAGTTGFAQFSGNLYETGGPAFPPQMP